jgi:hypothetical protein
MNAVMPRPLRIQYAGARYHVMSRGDRREAIFYDDADRLRIGSASYVSNLLSSVDSKLCPLQLPRPLQLPTALTIQSRFDCCQKVEGHNVKCLDLTPIPSR